MVLMQAVLLLNQKFWFRLKVRLLLKERIMNLNSTLESMERIQERMHIKKFLIVLMLQMEKHMASLLKVKVDTQAHLLI